MAPPPELGVTNRDLTAQMAARRFRSDLFYRLSVFNVHRPPLRERGDDVLLLADHFIRTLGPHLALRPSAAAPPPRAAAPAPASASDPASSVKGPRSEDLERAAVLDALQRVHSDESRAAALLGLTRFQLYTRLKRHNIDIVPD